MLLDMTPVLCGDKDEIAFDYSFPYSECEGLIKDDVILTKPIRVSGKVVNRAGFIVLYLDIAFPYKTHCARCFCSIEGSFQIKAEKNVAAEAPENDNDDYLLICDGKLDIDTPVLEEAALSFPQKILCREDCKGLCPKCGADWNKGKCSCPEHEPDPRLAVLKNLIKNQE